MKSESVISERGQVTVPKELRDHLGLTPGTRVRFSRSASGLVIQKAGLDPDRVRKVYGLIKDQIRTDDYLETLRGKVE